MRGGPIPVHAVLATLLVSLFAAATARSAILPVEQSRRATVFASASSPDTFATDFGQVEAIDFGPFHDATEITVQIEGVTTHAVATHDSEILDDTILASGSFMSDATSELPDAFGEAFGQALFNLTIEIDEPVRLAITGTTDATGDGAVFFSFLGDGSVLVDFENLGEGSVMVDEHVDLTPGSYRIALNVNGFAQAPGGTGPFAEGSYDLTMSFTGSAAIAGGRTPSVALLARPNPSRGPVQFELGGAGPRSGALLIHDVAGRHVRTLMLDVQGRASWNGLTADGSRAAPGIYFYRRAGASDVLARRLVLVR
ncbi:MAG: hypothetical protein PVF43_12965 [Candidatus Eiseniibacteriota bacterium]|jgi:hypothetical protein